jgi:uncharacterized protein with PIN domain
MKFIVDRTLGKLAKGLRMLGYDTLYFAEEDLHQLIHLAREEGRTILTRDTKLAMKRPKDRIITITQDNPSRQIEEVVQKNRLSLDDEILFHRCLLCNEQLVEIPHQEADGKVPDFIFNQQKDFYRCPKCQRIYWKGSHLDNMQKKVSELLKISAKSQVNSNKNI